jgi:hypothetical protein
LNTAYLRRQTPQPFGARITPRAWYCPGTGGKSSGRARPVAAVEVGGGSSRQHKQRKRRRVSQIHRFLNQQTTPSTSTTTNTTHHTDNDNEEAPTY